MASRTLLSRLLSPAGFGLVLLFFLLPFVAISCTTPGGSVKASFTGTDMIVGGKPEISGPGIGPKDQDSLHALMAPAEKKITTEGLAIATAVVIFVGMLAGLFPERLGRHAMGSGLAALAIALLVWAELRSIDRLQAFRATSAGGMLEAPPAGRTAPEYGFWLATVALGLLLLGHGVALVRAWRQVPAQRSWGATAEATSST
jgi:hypothetical protein